MQKEPKNKAIIDFFKKNGGYARMKELKDASFHTRDIAKLIQNGILERIKPGIYRLSEIAVNGDEYFQMVDICTAFPKAVICLASALDMYDLSTFYPSEMYVAVPHNTRIPKIEYPPMRVFFFNEKCYKLGIETVKARYGQFNVYDTEKTICDMFKYRKKIGEDLAIEGLQNYMRTRKGRDLNKLMKYADVCRVKAVMSPYIKAILEQ
ncbi:MAG: type IV toxin-antitoxin system AbiEi family antitoxin domain-containing protein [Fibrobacteria bacterium]|nr:type IV toxin-antitoxin system AbiEi family antitoxin domain-containing protein [Fibrobacteria bacterium]